MAQKKLAAFAKEGRLGSHRIFSIPLGSRNRAITQSSRNCSFPVGHRSICPESALDEQAKSDDGNRKDQKAN